MTLRGNSAKQNDSGTASGSNGKGNNQNEAPQSGRHESSSSVRSTDTVKGPFSNVRGTPVKVNTNKNLQYVISFRISGRSLWLG